MQALEAENAALKASPVRVELDGRRWSLREAREALERLAAGTESGADEFLLDAFSGVDVDVMRQLQAYATLPDKKVAGEAAAGLRAVNLRNERWLELGKRDVREDVRKTEKRPPLEGDEWKQPE